MPFRDSNGRSVAGYGRSGMHLRSGKPPWLASYSIGCRQWVGLSPMRLAESEVQGDNAKSTRFMQQPRLSTALCVGDFGQSYDDGTSVRALGVRCKTINAGRMPSSRHRGFSPFMKPMCRRVNPDEATTNWRAVCGRTASTVRRAGRARALSDPYPFNYRLAACEGHLDMLK